MLEYSTDSELSSGSLFGSDESNGDSDSEYLGDNPEIVDDVQEGGANENIITGTWSNCGKWHHIYFDNYFSSLKLTKLLLTHNSCSCGTALRSWTDV
jgi:hypothetical protein